MEYNCLIVNNTTIIHCQSVGVTRANTELATYARFPNQEPQQISVDYGMHECTHKHVPGREPIGTAFFPNMQIKRVGNDRC